MTCWCDNMIWQLHHGWGTTANAIFRWNNDLGGVGERKGKPIVGGSDRAPSGGWSYGWKVACDVTLIVRILNNNLNTNGNTCDFVWGYVEFGKILRSDPTRNCARKMIVCEIQLWFYILDSITETKVCISLFQFVMRNIWFSIRSNRYRKKEGAIWGIKNKQTNKQADIQASKQTNKNQIYTHRRKAMS